ncbi:MAG: hypothetical protein CVV25_13255 [Ignavibacteriae bacterium HGW-Ignavibacteriae-4]|jgi:hypothetical protein|nr:MAG: hypothetical protein CVV25_13255 [Ignavibacteriae bacterium HGW-Ignavibacteriae-4]
MTHIRIIVIALVLVTLNACVIVKKFETETREPLVKLSPKPIIAMQDDFIRSSEGDMIAAIPVGWFFVDLEGKASVGTIAIATTKDYNLTAVFKKLPTSIELEKNFKEDKEYGIAKYSYTIKANKTGGNCQLTSKYGMIEAGNLKYGTYRYSNTGGALTARTAVFKTDIDNYYEFTLIPTDIKGMSFPTEVDQENIFKSIIATMKY